MQWCGSLDCQRTTTCCLTLSLPRDRREQNYILFKINVMTKYLESPWKMHSNKCTYAWYWCSISWAEFNFFGIFITIMFLHSPWEIHSVKYKHAWYWCSISWMGCEIWNNVTTYPCRRHVEMSLNLKKCQDYRILVSFLESPWEMLQICLVLVV